MSDFAKYPDLLIAPPNGEELKQKWPEVGSCLADHCLEPMRDGKATKGAFYWMLREGGMGHKFAEMLALQRGPVLSTDDTFFEGAKPLYEQFGSQKHLNHYLKAAKRQGFTPPVNSVYFPGLARFPGDREAFVTRAMGRSYIRKLCEKRGWECDGAVNVDHRQPEEDPLSQKNCVALGEDIIRDRAIAMAEKNPDIKRMDRNELRRKIIDKHGPKGE